MSEEDIKNIEEIIELSKEEIDEKNENITAILDIEDLISLEHILSDYKRVLKENAELKISNKETDKECSRLEKKEVEMEKIINLMTKYISNITDCPLESEGAYLNCEEICDVRTDAECWKQYF